MNMKIKTTYIVIGTIALISGIALFVCANLGKTDQTIINASSCLLGVSSGLFLIIGGILFTAGIRLKAPANIKEEPDNVLPDKEAKRL